METSVMFIDQQNQHQHVAKSNLQIQCDPKQKFIWNHKRSHIVKAITRGKCREHPMRNRHGQKLEKTPKARTVEIKINI